MKVDDLVRKRITCSVTSGQTGTITQEEMVKHTGKVIYVHPKGRYYVAEFAFPDGTIKECYRN